MRRVKFGKISGLSYFLELPKFSPWPVVTQIVGEKLCEINITFPQKDNVSVVLRAQFSCICCY